ncbi:uncharacterized protein F4822DRAFT_83596 [Hypoxylon trugodes]|uniref:uncharacterized protein n=1 Tax=Hypoxylon trugodes TaxID=326681 RepID=UPI00219818FC|nr:uncharacterized protein F4822DRAFT_83596 [Hypoxylon trugodes]KAI1383641.1 hypothetical protein F4822DRAFT_83596 [Hypoxylon trugodes]
MANIGRFGLAAISNTLDSTQTLLSLNFDFSIAKFEPPREFHELGRCLTAGRRSIAEDGLLHITARRLAASFRPLLPQTPTLIKCYGLRASEIAKASTESLPDSVGVFTSQVGIDGTSIWAGATSGEGAIQVHLLACMLARIWSGPEATSIWVELLESRLQEIRNEFQKLGLMDVGVLSTTQQQIDRSQLAEWDASARAWLRIADAEKSLPQKQLLLIIENLSRKVNSKPSVYHSVMKAWISGLEGMESLLQNSPMGMQTGDLLLALSSWHLYPDLNILGPATKVIHQRDPLVPPSGILTIGMEPNGFISNGGLQWSLPLAHLRYYGDPVVRTGLVSTKGSRLSLVDFKMAVLGCVIGGWGVDDRGVEDALRWIKKLSRVIGRLSEASSVMSGSSWLSILGEAAHMFLTSTGSNREFFTRVLNLGRNHAMFIGETSLPYFGMADVRRTLSLSNTIARKTEVLRSLANSMNFGQEQAIIRHIPEEALSDHLSNPARPRLPPKQGKPEQRKTNTRWITSWATRNRARSKSLPDNGYCGCKKIRYSMIGEDITPMEDEPLQTIHHKEEPTDVVQNAPEMGNDCEEDRHKTRSNWFEHYERWVGDDANTVAIFLRLYMNRPSARQNISSTALYQIFEDALEDHMLLPIFLDGLESLERPYLTSLWAFATMASLYGQFGEATIDARVFEASLFQADWYPSPGGSFAEIYKLKSVGSWAPDLFLPQFLKLELKRAQTRENLEADMYGVIGKAESSMDSSRESLDESQPDVSCRTSAQGECLEPKDILQRIYIHTRPQDMSTQQSFSCVLFFENFFHIPPPRLENVIALSSGNSLFIATSLLSDPINLPPRRGKIRHVMGNLGRSGTALLVPPTSPRMMKIGIDHWYFVNHTAWDGIPRDCFQDSTLHLKFTGWTQEVDIGQSGAQDKEVKMLESVVSLYGKGEWVADLDVLKALYFSVARRENKSEEDAAGQDMANNAQPPINKRHPCSCKNKRKYLPVNVPLVAIENWFDLLDKKEEDSIFLATGNWQARLAAMMICHTQKRKACVLAEDQCFTCLASMVESSKGPTVYIY